jgi:hypothetical protein
MYGKNPFRSPASFILIDFPKEKKRGNNDKADNIFIVTADK